MKRHVPYTNVSVDPEIQRMKDILTSSEDIVIEVGKDIAVPEQSGSNESICDSEDEFIIRTVETELQNLSPRDKETLKRNPHPVMHHFGYGMYIRNRYIHGKHLGFEFSNPDELSWKIIEKIIRGVYEENSKNLDKDEAYITTTKQMQEISDAINRQLNQ